MAENNTEINTQGGASARDVQTRQGDFVGRDKVIQQAVTPVRNLRELEEWQKEHLRAAVEKYAQAQQKLLPTFTDPSQISSPYKGLDYFSERDRTIFYGRQAVIDEMAQRLLQSPSRLWVLHAPSGAGKTSLIRAGIIPRLLEGGSYALWATPFELRRAVLSYARKGPQYNDLSLPDFLGWVTDFLGLPPGGRLVAFLDQFERAFDEQYQEALEVLMRDIADCVSSSDEALPVRLVISIRSDFVGALDQFRRLLPGVLDQRQMLERLSREQALEAIEKPLHGWPVGWADGAAQAVLDYLAKGAIEPPHLQLICDQLYRQALKEQRPAITCADVQEHDLALLHRQYLQNQMHALGAQEELGWGVLKRLVTAQAIARPRPLEEVRQALGQEVEALVKDLVDRRILRWTPGALEKQVEITHETLAQEILQRQSPQEIRCKAAAELIGRGLDDWLASQKRVWMGAERLRLLDEYQDVLELPLLLDGGRSEAQGLEFLLRSALAAGYAVPFWFERAGQAGVDVQAIALEGLKAEKWPARAAAVGALAALAQGDQKFNFCQKLNFLLADEYPQVRLAAIRALERLQPSGEWRKHLKYECYVPAGAFIMGDDHSDENDEQPAHEVTLEAYYIARYPVTNADYRRFMADREQPYDLPAGKEQHPVVNMSWYEARQYCAWAGMRLPSEAEWEKAASWQPGPDLTGFRNLSGLRYPWGDAFDQNKCNTSESGINNTTPVGQYSPQGDSPYGCADMAGNVWEWTSSLYEDYPYRAQDGREDAASPGSRVQRGGSYWNGKESARCAYRGRGIPGGFLNDIGFRVVASLACSDC